MFIPELDMAQFPVLGVSRIFYSPSIEQNRTHFPLFDHSASNVKQKKLMASHYVHNITIFLKCGLEYQQKISTMRRQNRFTRAMFLVRQISISTM